MRGKNTSPTTKRGYSTLVMLVLFVFFVLFISIVIAGLFSYSLIRMGVLPSLIERRFPLLLTFISFISLFVGTIVSIFAGDRFLRPLNLLIEATKEIASGNFTVRVDAAGSNEMVRLSESFNDMARELSTVETLRSDFVRNISHEYKTPVVSIRGFARRLKKNNLTVEQRNEYIDIIISESDRLTLLSSNVLLLSRLENTDDVMENHRFYLDEQLRRTVLLLEPQLQKKQLDVEIDLDTVQIIANEEMLHHLWINLLGNAIKFSPHGGVVKVELKLDGNNAVVSITDSGIGMDDAEKKHIFDKFYQADQSRATEGNGLGMSLVKKILELQNGQIAVDSELGKGTCFIISLPKEIINKRGYLHDENN